jgi:hypothetical protein
VTTQPFLHHRKTFCLFAAESAFIPMQILDKDLTRVKQDQNSLVYDNHSQFQQAREQTRKCYALIV